MLKISQYFSITGRLFLHIASFLNDRLARIKYADIVGEWLTSYFGTSAGTSLGPILFIMHLDDIPKCIMPKFADDLAALAVGNDFNDISQFARFNRSVDAMG